MQLFKLLSVAAVFAVTIATTTTTATATITESLATTTTKVDTNPVNPTYTPHICNDIYKEMYTCQRGCPGFPNTACPCGCWMKYCNYPVIKNGTCNDVIGCTGGDSITKDCPGFTQSTTWSVPSYTTTHAPVPTPSTITSANITSTGISMSSGPNTPTSHFGSSTTGVITSTSTAAVSTAGASSAVWRVWQM